ncbi:MAG: hypothetical protein UV49_C0029G0002 [candidate division WWE3 bacterium GW2011_GWA2_42_9]|nr:MAG: hypothetical protein UV49_C0029G0002 [candidate division WWE3 bacterium GW2011_GWA2_42_9]
MSKNPFHAGEREAQQRVGVSIEQAPIHKGMSDQQRKFFTSVSFVAMAGMTKGGSLIATISTGPAGFIACPDPQTLHLCNVPKNNDPFSKMLVTGSAIGMLGMDFFTRQRCRANGHIAIVNNSGFGVSLLQCFGNCPKHITPRAFSSTPETLSEQTHYQRLASPDLEACQLIRNADTFFVASSSGPDAIENGGVDISHRGGPVGFVQTEGLRLTVPDFPGNRYFNTLGNFVRHPKAAMLFIDFATGDLLHLSDRVTINWNPYSLSSAERSWQMDMEEGWWLRHAVRTKWDRTHI